jgi:hypothetical protein
MYPVPVQYNPKDGPVTYSKLETYAVDWTIRMYDNASEKSFHPSSNEHAQMIARNTQNFEAAYPLDSGTPNGLR